MKTKTKLHFNVFEVAERIGRNLWKIGTLEFSYNEIIQVQRDLDNLSN